MAWDADETGKVAAFPLVSYETDVILKINCGVRFILARPEDEPATGSLVVQMTMTVGQAETLVQDLRKMMAEILAVRSLTLNVEREEP